jgi:branched-chain amino acid transport system ATP-binding protein
MFMDALLRCEGVSKYFGNFGALKNVSFEVFPKEIFGIAGPNGAGKSVLFNVITGVPYSSSSGRIIFNGQNIQKKPPHVICHMGIARTFQTPSTFKSLTVLENLNIGSYFGNPIHDKDIIDESEEMLDFVGLQEKKNELPENLSLFDRKIIMIASALISKPKLLLLDEPIGGLNEAEIEQTMELVKKINKSGITIIIIEHIMRVLAGISKRLMILNYGEKLIEGDPDKVVEDEEVIRIYLGDKTDFLEAQQ